MEKGDTVWYNVTTEFNGGLRSRTTLIDQIKCDQTVNFIKGKNNGKNG